MVSYAKKSTTLDAVVADATVVLNAENLRYFELSEIGARIWRLLDAGPVSIEVVVETLVHEFDVSPQHCSVSVEAFLKDGCAKGLLESS